MRCPDCGSENLDHAFFCGVCAKELKGSSSPVITTSLPGTAEDRGRLFNWYYVLGGVIGLIGFVVGLIARNTHTMYEALVTGLYFLALLLVIVGLFFTVKARRVLRD